MLGGTDFAAEIAREAGVPGLALVAAAVMPLAVEVPVRETVPLNPPSGLTVIADVPLLPAAIVTAVGFADNVKSDAWALASLDRALSLPESVAETL